MCPAQTKKVQSIYGVHPSVASTQKWIVTLKDKTGRSADEWVVLIRKEGPKSEKKRLQWLKDKHKLGTNSASWLAARAEGKADAEENPETYLEAARSYVEAQFAGKKEALRPMYESLLQLAARLGADVKACPCQTMVPLYRNHVFAQLKAPNNSRLDVGLALTHYKGKLPKRLMDTGGLAKKDRITHCIQLQTPDQIDAEVEKWLKIAYDLDAGSNKSAKPVKLV
jgi:hypothetical protein